MANSIKYTTIFLPFLLFTGSWPPYLIVLFYFTRKRPMKQRKNLHNIGRIYELFPEYNNCRNVMSK